MHQRKVIRDGFVAQLLGKTAAGARVVPSKVSSYRAIELPAISVYTLSEPIDGASKGRRPRELKRLLTVDVAAGVVHTEANPADVQMDAISEQIEAAISADPYIGGACHFEGAILDHTEIEIDNAADPPIGLITLTYTVPYAFEPAPGALDEFLTAGVTTVVDGATVENAAQDLVHVRPPG